MGDENNGHALIAVQRGSVPMISCEVLVSRLPVGSSASSRLGVDERARDGHPLLLTTGKLPGVLGSRSARPRNSSPARACRVTELVRRAANRRVAKRHFRSRWCGRED